jgi:hypothetical protein
MLPRLDIDALIRWLAKLYKKDRFASEAIACGKFALALLFGIIVVGACPGFVSAFATGADSVVLHVLNFAFVSALLANFLGIGWIAAARAARGLPAVDLKRKVPELPSACVSVCPRPSFRPPRSPA